MRTTVTYTAGHTVNGSMPNSTGTVAVLNGATPILGSPFGFGHEVCWASESASFYQNASVEYARNQTRTWGDASTHAINGSTATACSSSIHSQLADDMEMTCFENIDADGYVRNSTEQ